MQGSETMVTQEYAAQNQSEGGKSAVALGYAVIAVSGLCMGLLLAWIF